MFTPVFEFAQSVDRDIAKLSREEYYLRKGRAKRLLEELYPLSRFAIHLVFPGNVVEVEAPENDGPFDGIIRFGASDPRELTVQVTYIQSYEDALRRELLWNTGSAPGAGPIYREKSTGKIISKNVLVPIDQEIEKLASNIVDLHNKKSQKHYERGTILLVAFDDPTFFGRAMWQKLITAVDSKSDLSGGGFSEVHFFNCGSNELQLDA